MRGATAVIGGNKPHAMSGTGRGAAPGTLCFNGLPGLPSECNAGTVRADLFATGQRCTRSYGVTMFVSRAVHHPWHRAASVQAASFSFSSMQRTTSSAATGLAR